MHDKRIPMKFQGIYRLARMEQLHTYLPTTYHKIAASLFTIFFVHRIIKLITTTTPKQRFRGKKILITGASSGIGEELAYQLAAAGARTISLCARNVNELERVAKKCNEISSTCETHVIQMDVSSQDSCK